MVFEQNHLQRLHESNAASKEVSISAIDVRNGAKPPVKLQTATFTTDRTTEGSRSKPAVHRSEQARSLDTGD
jgi:hypothetical protein